MQAVQRPKLPLLRKQLMIQTSLHHDYFEGQDFAERVYQRQLAAMAAMVVIQDNQHERHIKQLRRWRNKNKDAN